MSVIGLGKDAFLRARPDSATERALAEAADALLGVAEMGGLMEATDRLTSLSRRFDSYGLVPVAQALRGLAASDGKRLPDKLLEAVFIVDAARALIRPVPGLRLL